MIALTLENPLYLFADDSTFGCDVLHPSGRQAAASSLSSDIEKKITSWSNTWNMSFNPDKSHTLTISLKKHHMANPPIYFLNNPLEEVKSLKCLGLAISRDLCLEKPHLKVSLQSQLPTGHPPSYKVLYWHR